MFQERALKNPPAYWALNVRKVVLGTQESRLGPAACGVAGSDARPITGEPGKWPRAVERQSERVVVLLEVADKLTAGEGRARTSSMHGKDEKDSDECRIG